MGEYTPLHFLVPAIINRPPASVGNKYSDTKLYMVRPVDLVT